MSLFFLISFIFSSFFVQAQQGFIPKPVYEYDFNEFDWQSFTNEGNIQSIIDFRNETFNKLGIDFIIPYVNIGKADLLRIEQELSLYEQSEEYLSAEEIAGAREAIRQHRENIFGIESVILDQGFEIQMIAAGTSEFSAMERESVVQDTGTAIEVIKKLYKGDEDIVFNLVEKVDVGLFSALGGNDEAYAKAISPYVERYTAQMADISQRGYYEPLMSAGYPIVTGEWGQENIKSLIDMHSGSYKIYKCFIKNFQNPVGEHQRALKQTIESWYESQSMLGASAVISSYKQAPEALKQAPGAFNPFVVVDRLNNFKAETPVEVKAMIAEFYKKDIINNPEFIETDDSYKWRTRADALVGLQYLGVLEEDRYQAERELFERAIEAGVIKQLDATSYSTDYIRPIP